MSWTLGGLTLPKPKAYTRTPYEISRDHLTIDGSTKKDFVRQKWIYSIKLTYLTQSEVAQILAKYTAQTTQSFSVSDGDLTIGAVDVWVEISDRQYITKGSEYREDITLILREV